MKRKLVNCLAFLALGVIPVANAVDIYCVGGTGAAGDASLANALVQSSINAHVYGSDTEIRIQQRNQAYALTSAPAFGSGQPPPYNGIKIRGGYTEGTCSPNLRHIDPTNTSINVQMGSKLSIVGNGLVYVDGLTFLSGSSTIVSISSVSPSAANAYVRRNIFKTSLYATTDANVPTKIYIDNNLIFGAETLRLGGLGADITSYVSNNTIVNGGGIDAGGHGLKVYIYNNIIWGNSLGITTEHDFIPVYTLVNNILQSDNAIDPGGTIQGTISSDPKFANSANDFHLASGSPAIDSGVDSLPGGVALSFDVEGNDRLIGAHPDRGAYESSSPAGAPGAVITVNSNSDSANPGGGKTSLRGAIALSNQSNVPVTINFNIPGAGCASPAQTIVLTSPLPNITRSVTIDGYTQPGSSRNTTSIGFNAKVCVAIAGTNTAPSGLIVDSSAANDVKLEAMGLRIFGFQRGIDLKGGASHRIVGNLFWKLAPYVDNSIGVSVSENASSVSVGGLETPERNLFAGSGVSGVFIASDNNFVFGNLIGAGFDGLAAAGSANKVGVRIAAGNFNAVQGNTISGNTVYGIEIVNSSANNYVQGNLIGINDGGICGNAICTPFDSSALPNGVAGVYFEASASQNFLFSNEVAYNPVGICVASDKVVMIGNSLYDSGILAVDLDKAPGGILCKGDVNPNNNDVMDSSSPNAGQNYPVLLWAGGEDGSGLPDGNIHEGKVRGQLPSKNGNFTIFYFASDQCGPQGFGEGKEPLGLSKVTITDAASNNGLVNFEADIASTLVLSGRAITAQARHDATGNFSEFSRCVKFVRDTADIATDDRIFVDSLELKPAGN